MIVIGLTSITTHATLSFISPVYRQAAISDLMLLLGFFVGSVGIIAYSWEAMSKTLGRKTLLLVKATTYVGNLLFVVGFLSRMLGLRLIPLRHMAQIGLWILFPVALIGQHCCPLPSLRSLLLRKAEES